MAEEHNEVLEYDGQLKPPRNPLPEDVTVTGTDGMDDDAKALSAYREHLTNYLVDFDTNMQGFLDKDKQVITDIYGPVYNIFYGMSYTTPELNAVAAQSFGAGILLGLFIMNKDYEKNPKVAREVAMHYAASFWDALTTTFEVQEAREEEALLEEVSEDEDEDMTADDADADT